MSISVKPVVKTFDDGSKIWEQSFNSFNAKVYKPVTELPEDIVNFGYSAPYLIYFEEKSMSAEEAKIFADISKLAAIAAKKAGTVVFVSPSTGDWTTATQELYKEIISNSKIHQYYEDGYAILNNRFTHQCDGYAIRGAIFRVYLFAKGKAADYIASNLLKVVNGDGLWGPADVCPTVCILENLSVEPKIERRNMPVVSICNSDKINEVIKAGSDFTYFAPQSDYQKIFDDFVWKFKRWGWVGDLQFEPDFDAIGMIEEPCYATVKTSPDNNGDDKGTETHRIGYISYYNKNLFTQGPAPLLLCFHGGGDSAKHIAQVSEWYRVAHDHNFLLVCIENHIESTATEMMELLEILKKQYKIDQTRIYASGFSMGGCKTWDMYQEYPEVFAALAPMDATFDVGQNVYGMTSPCQINQNQLVPIFYVGGEETPLPELPCQAPKCRDRMEYVFKVNGCTTEYNVKFEEKDSWPEPIWGIGGDEVIKAHDNDRNSDITMHRFKSGDDKVYTVFAGVSGQGHECRYHSCEQAWLFMEKFQRVNGKICTE